MAKFLALQVLSGKMAYADVQNKYPKYADDVLQIIHDKGYTIDIYGQCVKVHED